mgnify:CR=1 FL=1
MIHRIAIEYYREGALKIQRIDQRGINAHGIYAYYTIGGENND